MSPNLFDENCWLMMSSVPISFASASQTTLSWDTMLIANWNSSMSKFEGSKIFLWHLFCFIIKFWKTIRPIKNLEVRHFTWGQCLAWHHNCFQGLAYHDIGYSILIGEWGNKLYVLGEHNTESLIKMSVFVLELHIMI